MNDTIRLIHFADLHLGVETHGTMDPDTGLNSRVADFLNTLDNIIDEAVVAHCDIAIFAGDAFKNPRPTPTMQREFAERIKTLAEYMPVLLLVGNHDAPKSVHRANSLDIFSALDVENVIVGSSPGGEVIQTQNGELYLAWMPFPFRERLLSKQEYREASIGEIDEIFKIKVQTILRRMANEAQEYDMPRILAGHFGVVGAEPGISTAYFMHDVLVNAEFLSEHWDYVALGHYHGFQQLHDSPPVIYSGSPERISFNEQEEAKGFILADVSRGNAITEFKQLASREFATITIDVRDSSDPTGDTIKHALSGVADGMIVRVKIKMNAEQEISEREIETALAGAAHLIIIKEVEDPARLRLQDESFSTMSPVDLTSKYFAQKGLIGERHHQHLNAAKEIIDDTDRD